MAAETKTIREINAKLKSGQAVVMTAMEFKEKVRNGHKFTVSDVDVVTTGTRGVMSGTSAMLVIPVAEEGSFRRAKKIWLNGVPGIPSSNPEDGSGLVDTVIYGTEESCDFHGQYGGGHVLRDLIEGKDVEVECLTSEGDKIWTTVNLEQLTFARIYSFRNNYENYMSFMNIKNHKSYRENPRSIFACRPIPQLKGFGMSGSGELNPLQNDPRHVMFKTGMKVLMNGAPGVLTGYGTRSTPEMRCLSFAADMSGMDPQFMGGFKTSYGVEITNSVAVPFPILNQDIIDDLSDCLDENIPMRLGDIGDRIRLLDLRYGDVWRNTKLEIAFDADRCISCSFQCPAEYYCPMRAISWKDKEIDEERCFGCGACTVNCMGGAFMGKGELLSRGHVGTINVFEKEIPIIFRQSNRYRSELHAQILKDLMERGEFLMNDTTLEMQHWNLE